VADADLEERMARARMELSHKDEFKYLLFNDNLTEAAERLAEIIARERAARRG
ncbi:MAG: guanylate kinase, partial [Planctomycetes bacterium]|nr:guanylate kinase [Planctomycetota bacterium]